MARCDQGYLCDVCGKDVEAITESDLYLRYVMGEVDPLALPTMRERHIRCNPAMAQYIADPAFERDLYARAFSPRKTSIRRLCRSRNSKSHGPGGICSRFRGWDSRFRNIRCQR